MDLLVVDIVNRFTSFAWPMLRITALLLAAPLFSVRAVPRRIRVLLGFALPTLHLVQLARSADAIAADPRFLADAMNSLALAAAAAAIIVVLAVFLSYAGRVVRNRSVNRLIAVSYTHLTLPTILLV